VSHVFGHDQLYFTLSICISQVKNPY